MPLSQSTEPPFSFKAYISKVGGEENSGSALVKYRSTVGKDESVQSGRTKIIDVKFNCITILKEYEDKSLEELRLEDYRAGRFSKEPTLGNFLYKFLSKAEPAPNPRSPAKKTGAQLAYEVLSKRFETKIFIPKKRSGVGEQGSGSTLVKYIPKVDKDVVVVSGQLKDIRVQVNCITAMKEYEDKSLEELRLEDYKAGRKLLAKYIKNFDETRSTNKPSIFVFGFKKSHAFTFRDNEHIDTEPTGGIGEQSGSALVKYIPKVDKEVIFVSGLVEDIKVQVNCITAMKEYEDKSVEELRFEDYEAGRKPPAKCPLRFHSVHGENIRLSEDRTIAERTYSHYGGVAFTSRPIRVGEKIYVQLVKISKNWATLSGISFGFTTENPAGIAHSVPIFGNSLKNSWIINLNKELCKKDTILHYYVNAIGELRFGVNGKIQKEILSKVEINRPLWAVVDVYGRCKMVQFVGPKALYEVRQPDQGVGVARQPIISQIEEGGRSNQAVDGSRQPDQVVGGVRKPDQVVESTRQPDQVVGSTKQPDLFVGSVRQPDRVVGGVRQPVQVVDCARQLKEVVDEARRLKEVVDKARRVDQAFSCSDGVVDGARQANQVVGGHVVVSARRPNEVIDEVRRPNQSQVIDGNKRPSQVIDRASRSNISQAEYGPRRPNQSQIIDGAKQSNQVIGAVRCSEHVVGGARQPNLNQVGDGARQSNQVVDGARRTIQNQAEDGPRRPNPNQIGDGARQPNQVIRAVRCSEHVVGGARRPHQLLDETRQPNEVVGGARRPNQLLDEARHPDSSSDEDDPLVNELQSLSVAEPIQSPFLRALYRNAVPLYLHKTKGRNVHFTGRGIAARHPGEYCQGYVFSARPMAPGKTITAQVLDTEDSNQGSLAIGFTSCDPGSLRSDELPDEAEFLLDRPEYWVVYSDAANGLRNGDELEITLTHDGKVEVNSNTRNGSTLVTVLHVDHTLKLWAFFDVYGATQKMRFQISKLGRSPGQDLNGARRNNQVLDRARHDQIFGDARLSNNQGLDRARLNDLFLESARLSNNQGLDRPRNHNQDLDSARISNNQNLNKARQNRTPSTEEEEDLPSTSKNYENFKDKFPRTECIICFDSPINSVLYKCGHMCLCYDCAVQQWKNYGKVNGKCPLCRATIKDVIRTYNS